MLNIIFFLGIAIEYTVNALFFNDETIHRTYVNKGLFDFENQIPISIYSFLITKILNFPISLLGFTNDKIIDFKQNQISQGNKKGGNELILCLKIKFVFYFIIGLIFL